MKAIVIAVLLVAICGESLSRELHKPERLEYLRSHSKLDGRIIDGSPAAEGQFPWHAFVLTTASIGTRIACGGSLISPTWILTAAHCSTGFTSFIAIGDVNYTNSPHTMHVYSLHPHPDFNSVNFNNDIGLIELLYALAETDSLKPIQFYRDPSVSFEGITGDISGYGLTENSTAVSATLNYVSVTVISNEECAMYYGDAVVVSSSMCAVGAASSAQGACSGDSGGGLIHEVDGEKFLIGLVSFGSSFGCTYPTPNGFVRPSHFASWIDNVTGQETK